MSAVAKPIVSFDVRAFIEEYFDAWKGTDDEYILSYYADNVTIDLPTGRLEGKSAVRDMFVRPFIAGFPGNVHAIRNLVYGGGNLVAVEWNFLAKHQGEFNGVPATGNDVHVPGCSLYEFNGRQITAGRIYFDVPTLLRQIGGR